jgi:putative transposase
LPTLATWPRRPRNLTGAQQRLARCKRGSNRRRKQREQVARIHRKIRRQRLDHAHKTALRLVRHHDLLAHEVLRIANMTRSAAGTVELSGRNPAKSGLNRSILDAGWGMFLTILVKAEAPDGP